MYQTRLTERFKRNANKVIGNDKSLKDKVLKVLELIKTDPFQPQLKTHKVNAKDFGPAWSTRVTDDVRIIWCFSKLTAGEI